jgi:hypothetical protein
MYRIRWYSNLGFRLFKGICGSSERTYIAERISSHRNAKAGCSDRLSPEIERLDDSGIKEAPKK